MYNTKTEPSCKLWALGNKSVSTLADNYSRLMQGVTSEETGELTDRCSQYFLPCIMVKYKTDKNRLSNKQHHQLGSK